MADQSGQQAQQSSVQSSPIQQQPQQLPGHGHPQLAQQQQQQMHQHLQQQQQQQSQQPQQQLQQPRVSNVGTVSLQGMVTTQAPTPQPNLTPSPNILRAPGAQMPQLQFIPQFSQYTYMVQNPNTIAMQFSPISYPAMQQQAQQQQQQRATPANPGSPGGILSPTAAASMPTHISLGNGNNIITGAMQGVLTQGAVSNGGSKSQSSGGGKGQPVQAQAQNAMASMVAKNQTVLPAPPQTAPPMVLGQIFSSQANTNLANNYVPQCATMNQAGIRLNQAQVVNSAGQIITSQPVQSLLTNQAIMQAMANLQMQQGIPIAAGHQQLMGQGQTLYATPNLFIRTQAPLQQQPITMTSMQAAAAFPNMKPQQQQQQTTQPQQACPTGKVILPSVQRTPATAKIQPSISQPNKVSVPAMPRAPKSRPKAQPRTPVHPVPASTPTPVHPQSQAGKMAASPTSTASSVMPLQTSATTLTAVVTSIPSLTLSHTLPPHPSQTSVVSAVGSGAETSPSKMSQNVTPTKTSQHSEMEPLKTMTTPVTPEPTQKDKLRVTAASTTTHTTITVTTIPTGKSSISCQSTAVTVAPPSVMTTSLPRPTPTEVTAAAGSKVKIDNIILEEKPKLSDMVKPPSASVIDPAAMAAAGLMTLIKDSKQIIPHLPVVEKQRAIVKPQILTHIIEGFVIQEGSEPFPVQQSTLLQEFIPPKASQQIVKESEEEGTSYDDEPPTLLRQVEAHLSSTQVGGHFPPRQEKADQEKSPVKLLKCEMCQKMAPASNFNSTRFCSLTCSRRHSVGQNRRVGIYKPRGNSRKRKHILGRKHWRASKGVRLPFAMSSGNSNVDADANEDSNTAPVGDEMSSSNSVQETSSSAASPPRPQDYDMDMEANIPRTDPGKWTVTEVYEFIQSMPGCREYAEEFRSQEIDGQALLLLKEDHLMTAMNIKLGPALKICSKINSLKSEQAPS